MMIIISMLIAVLVGSSCVWLMFEVLKHGSAVSFAESDQFDFVSQGAAEMAEHCLQDGFDRKSEKNLQNLLDSASLRPEIQEGGSTAIAATNTMAVYKSTEKIQNRTYSINLQHIYTGDAESRLLSSAKGGGGCVLRGAYYRRNTVNPLHKPLFD